VRQFGNTAQALLFLEEITSIVLTPFVLYFSLPKCAPAILAFVRDFSVHVPGVGDICSLGAFDFERHGNSKYGSPSQAPKVRALCLP
jgi:autophagy-related protein 9